ncbi:Sodium-coupled monocarboxylate transporter 2 [Eufriesea mexicana]|uniref:sodium-coupled monocarboxylate transporter 2-like n=1 Tax=Eufriesea mexicana TaxID=516756 RepID=UPI00083C26A1|nr:PREDICTED: sodium-coupled monocarboxylate transporter 2-like [Eufriesea mexicana]OAD59039.1 Sodium-coupled monocarboxylate transporter 2 [Eufriesea mexicana]
MAENETTLGGQELRELTFGWTDYSLFSGLLGISVLIGIYFGCFSKKQDNTTEYLLGGKTMSCFPVSMSLIASHISAVSLLAIPVEVYQYGTQYAVCIFTATISCGLISLIYVPVFYQLQLTSTFEYLEMRFTRPVRLFASFLYSLSLVIYVPLIIYVPALAFSQATAINIYLITPVICIVCIFYTTIGGLKAVVWADTIQMTVTLGSLFAVFILGTIAVGGVFETWRVSEEGGRIIFWNMDPSPFIRNSFWGMSIGMTTTWLSGLGISQVSMQRFLAVPNIREAHKAIAFMGLCMVIMKWVSVFTGLIMYTRYHSCDPISTKIISRSDQLLPYYVLDVAANVPGLPGLFLAGLVSAGLSTMSANLNTVAGTIYEDFIDPWLPDCSNKESRAANIMKGIVVVVGLVCMMLVFVVDRLGDVFRVSLTLHSITSGAMLGIFTLGMIVPWATSKGAITGGLLSMLFMVWIIVGAQVSMAQNKLNYPPLPTSNEDCLNVGVSVNKTTTGTGYSPPSDDDDKPFVLFTISFMYYALVGFVIVMVIGTIVSFIFGANDLRTINRNHFPPIIQRFLPPEKYTDVPMHSIPNTLVSNPEKEKLNS